MIPNHCAVRYNSAGAHLVDGYPHEPFDMLGNGAPFIAITPVVASWENEYVVNACKHCGLLFATEKPA